MNTARSTARSAVHATSGMICTAHPLATAAGLRMLQDGGNAVDAALCAAAVTWAAIPMMCGLGGDAFMLVYTARTGQLTAIKGSGAVGARATPEYLHRVGAGRQMPLEGLMSASIPGAVDAFEQALQRFGTRSWAQILAPAIRAAEGHPVHRHIAEEIRRGRLALSLNPDLARIFLPDGKPLGEGDILVQANLARTLRKLSYGGAESFYRGELGAAIARHTGPHGLFTAEELARHRSEIDTPIHVSYRGYEIHQTAPPSQGLIHLMAHKIVEAYNLAELGPTSVTAHHVMIEAKKLAVQERLRLAGDPRFVDIPLDHLLSEAHAAELRRHIDLDQALKTRAGFTAGDTTSLVVVDRSGNCVSLIHSLASPWGARVTIDDTGILLNNRAGRGFVLDEGHPNQIAPGKRTMHTLNTYIITQNGQPVVLGNTPGGDGQPQWNLQVVTALLDWGFDPQEAVEMPRWTHGPSTEPALSGNPESLVVESRFSRLLAKGLVTKGHLVHLAGPHDYSGAAQVIKIDHQRGVYTGGSDPRADGHAMGY